MGCCDSKTFVANATRRPILVYYDVDRLKLQQIVFKAGVEPSVSGKVGLGTTPASVTAGVKASGKSELVWKPDDHEGFVRIPSNDCSQIIADGDIYVTIYIEGNRSHIVEDYQIPKNKSLIVTKNFNVKFSEAKNEEDIWVDESGYDHAMKLRR